MRACVRVEAQGSAAIRFVTVRAGVGRAGLRCCTQLTGCQQLTGWARGRRAARAAGPPLPPEDWTAGAAPHSPTRLRTAACCRQAGGGGRRGRQGSGWAQLGVAGPGGQPLRNPFRDARTPRATRRPSPAQPKASHSRHVQVVQVLLHGGAPAAAPLAGAAEAGLAQGLAARAALAAGCGWGGEGAAGTGSSAQPPTRAI